VEGSAETGGRVSVVMVLHRKLPAPSTGERGAGSSDSSSSSEGNDDDDDEQELVIAAVVFAADLGALDNEDADFTTCATAPPADWFNRHNHLPRLWRGYCEAHEREAPAWAAPMRSFLARWRSCSPTEEDSMAAEEEGGEEDEECATGRPVSSAQSKGCFSARERFVRSVEALADTEKAGSVVADWADRGVLAWLPPRNSGLVVPELDEWHYFRQRVG